MEPTLYSFFGALLGSVIGFTGSAFATLGKSRDTSKEILTRTVTNERSQWRKELREVSATFVENALRIAGGDADGSIYSLEKQRVQIRLRLNPNPEHKLDASISRMITRVVDSAKALDTPKILESVEGFESGVQALLKQEWDKSKKEAETGKLYLTAQSDNKQKED